MTTQTKKVAVNLKDSLDAENPILSTSNSKSFTKNRKLIQEYLL